MEILLLLGIGLLAASFVGGGGSDDDDDGPPDQRDVEGTDGDDLLDGEPGERVFGRAGNDSIGGDDASLFGGEGDDSVWGRGDSHAFGGAGSDIMVVRNGAGAWGGDGNDGLTGDGMSSIYGGAGDDQMTTVGDGVGFGGLGRDTLWATDDATISGGYGDDALRGTDDASLDGGAGDDLLVALRHATADGGAGNDDIFLSYDDLVTSNTLGDHLAATATGGEGSDRFVVGCISPSTQPVLPGDEDRITDFDPLTDQLVLSADGPIGSITFREEDGDTIVTAISDRDGLTGDPVDDAKVGMVRLVGVTDYAGEGLQVANQYSGTISPLDTMTYDGQSGGQTVWTIGGDDRWIDTGGGNDDVRIDGGQVSTVLTGDGDDTVRTEAHGILATGEGDDDIIVELPPYVDAGDLPSTGSGDSMLVYGGAGDDSIAVQDDVPGRGVAPAYIHGGAGDDTIIVDENVVGNVTVEGGSGSDDITLWSRGNSEVGLAGGTGADADTLTLLVDGESGEGGTPSIYLDSTPDDRIEIQVDATVTGSATWVLVRPYPSDPGYDFTSLRIGEVEVARFPGSDDISTDPRITITRGAVF